MPLEICNSLKVLDAASSPCVTCSSRESCPVQLLHRQLQLAEMPKVTHKRSIVSACSGYSRAGDPPVFMDISDSLEKADAKNLCLRCDEPAKGSCEEQRGLEAIKAMAKATYGITVDFAVFCCRTKTRLSLPIGQPGFGG